MSTIVTRAGKGSPLTNNEVDANFTNLNSDKVETITSTDGSVTVTGTGSTRNLSVPVNPAVVSGPASATDNALARFDGTTGKLIQNSVITQDDNGTLAQVNGISLKTSPTSPPTAVGSIFWDSGNGSPSVVLDADVSLQLGQEQIARVYNGTGSTIPNGSVVAVTGAQGQRPSVVLADADSEPLSASTLGVATEDIANGAEGFICTFGLVRGLNTSGFTAGAPLYLSQTAGQLTSTRPSAPAHTVQIGWAIFINASSGEVFVNINNGWELDELHNVLITSAASGNTLIYDAVTGVWENANITGGTGLSVTNGAGTIALANTGVTSVNGVTGAVTATNLLDAIKTVDGAGSGLDADTLDGNSSAFFYPASNPNGYTTNTGTVTSVSATAGTGISISGSPITTSGTLTITNTAPDQTVSLTGSGATSISGTYPNFTISSVNTTYSAATSTTLGLIELGSDTVQTVAPNAVTATASRSYALQVNSAGQAVVNVPWTDTNSGGTVTSVSGTGTVNGLSLSGSVTTSGSLTLSGAISGVPNSATTATSANTANAIVARDASGNFSAGTITATLNGNASTATSATSATSATNATNTTNVNLTNDTTTNTTHYFVFGDVTSGNDALKVSSTKATYNPSTGSAVFSGDVTSSSDERLKTNWRPVVEDFVTKLAEVKSGIYDRIDIESTQAGVSAQSLEQVLSQAVVTAPDGTKSVNYGNAALVAAIELAKQVVALQKEIAELKGKL